MRTPSASVYIYKVLHKQLTCRLPMIKENCHVTALFNITGERCCAYQTGSNGKYIQIKQTIDIRVQLQFQSYFVHVKYKRNLH